RSLRSLRRAERLTPWLYTIVRRTVLNEIRRSYATPEELVGDSLDEFAHPDTESNPTSAFENAELVHYGLSRLGLVEREVLTLFFLEEMSIDEVATVLEIPPGTVKSRLARARGELRQILERDGNSPAFEVNSR
ncbi:MAG: sigma-70 family RNA polymerase sigma factor, partial [Planctomycetota bacterium]|nr:sigma-70 family RNA polymerase sigma factor [Planctomycetota bacterium]